MTFAERGQLGHSRHSRRRAQMPCHDNLKGKSLSRDWRWPTVSRNDIVAPIALQREDGASACDHTPATADFHTFGFTIALKRIRFGLAFGIHNRKGSGARAKTVFDLLHYVASLRTSHFGLAKSNQPEIGLRAGKKSPHSDRMLEILDRRARTLCWQKQFSPEAARSSR